MAVIADVHMPGAMRRIGVRPIWPAHAAEAPSVDDRRASIARYAAIQQHIDA